MTNKEYIEKNNISFSEAMKMYDNEKYPCINDWLNQEYQEHKFNIGDFVKPVPQLLPYISKVGVIVGLCNKKGYYKVKAMDRKGNIEKHSSIGYVGEDMNEYIFIAREEKMEKIF